jgi:imidazolonepropionase-like amidohydrolase
MTDRPSRFRVRGTIVFALLGCLANNSPAAVVIEDSKIKEVGSPQQVQAHLSGEAKTIDLGNATLLPGLIDGHTHLLIDPIAPAEVEPLKCRAGRTVLAQSSRESLPTWLQWLPILSRISVNLSGSGLS